MRVILRGQAGEGWQEAGRASGQIVRQGFRRLCPPPNSPAHCLSFLSLTLLLARESNSHHAVNLILLLLSPREFAFYTLSLTSEVKGSVRNPRTLGIPHQCLRIGLDSHRKW